MRNLIIIFLFITFSIYSQDVVTLKKGEVAPFSGKLVKDDKLEKLVKDSMEKNGQDILIPRLESKITFLEEFNKEIIIEKDYWKEKFNSALKYQISLEKDKEKLQKRLAIAWTVNGIGWSISIGETIGLIVAIIDHELKKEYGK